MRAARKRAGTGTDLGRGRSAQSLVSADNSSGLEHINTLGGFDAVWEIDLFENTAGPFRPRSSTHRPRPLRATVC